MANRTISVTAVSELILGPNIGLRAQVQCARVPFAAPAGGCASTLRLLPAAAHRASAARPFHRQFESDENGRRTGLSEQQANGNDTQPASGSSPNM
jgi:hypothetical protein